MTPPILYIVVPCYNEQDVLPQTAPMFLQKLKDLSARGKISEESRVLFVNDGSRDDTWRIICDLARQDRHFMGIAQSRNRGHQNALLAGLMEAMPHCDITISIDCEAEKCMYNSNYKCTASHVDIRGCHACDCRETACDTFREA